ncbi:unnamed protein product [Musa acuminata subsp. burmannicoides]
MRQLLRELCRLCQVMMERKSRRAMFFSFYRDLQYAVTVDVLYTVFSAFGIVQKILIFEKNGGMQALIQYSGMEIIKDVSCLIFSSKLHISILILLPRRLLEGHCIYDGGYCKLHLTYSRHTDLNLKVHNERSRDYTIQDTGVPMMSQAPGLPTTSG